MHNMAYLENSENPISLYLAQNLLSDPRYDTLSALICLSPRDVRFQEFSMVTSQTSIKLLLPAVMGKYGGRRVSMLLETVWDYTS